MLVSSSTNAEERVKGLALGAVDFLTKPFNSEELLIRVRNHLESGRLRTQLEAQVAKRTEELLGAVEQMRREIAERRHTELALNESENRFRKMADTAPVMIATSGPDQLATFFNKAWLDFTGRTLEQELGRGWTEGVHPDERERCLAHFVSLTGSRGECILEYRLRRADGEYRTMMCRGVPRFEPGGTFVGYIGSVIDITELKRNQEEAIAREKLESLGVLAAGIAHDFNNLLASILANSQLLTSELNENAPGQECVARIQAVAKRGAEIVRQLSVYAGQENNVFELVDLAEVVREILQRMKASIVRKAVLRVDLPKGLPGILANAAQIRQLVMNLIANASDALEGKEGIISIAIAREPAEQGSIRDRRPSGDYLKLEVHDTGCGMAEEIQAGIFDPFFTTKGAGRGLGLAAVQGIVRSHGGAIKVTSAPRQGSRFEILLPCVGETKSDLAGEDATPAPYDRGERAAATILMIEDTEEIRLPVAKMLRKKGFLVLETGDGRVAVDLYRTQATRIDIVLLDLTLPSMSGEEILQELQKIRPDVKIIVTTAHARDRALAAVRGSRSWSYVRKPYQFTELIDALRRSLPEK
jgi:PAS domain S-box-containing protein